MSSVKISKNVWSIFFLYILLYYIFPFIMRCIYDQEYNVLYTRQDNLLAFIFVPFFIFLVILINSFWKTKEIFNFRWLGDIFEMKWLNICVLVISVYISLYFYSTYDLKFRQQESMSEAGSMVILLFFLRIYIKLYLLYVLLKFMNGIAIIRYQYFIVSGIVICFILTIMSSFDMIFIFIGFLIFIKKINILFYKKKKSQGLLKRAFKIVVILLLGYAVVFIGNANKIGVENATEYFTDLSNIGDIFLKTSIRFSVYYASVMSVGSLDFFNNDLAFQTIEGVFYNMSSRLDVLLGNVKSAERLSYIWSVNRANYLQLFHDTTNPKTGTSPGIIASSFYLPFFPFNFIIVATFMVFILRRLSKVINDSLAVYTTFFSKIVLLLFVIPLFDNPVDHINIISMGAIYLILFIGLADKIENLKYTNCTKSNQ